MNATLPPRWPALALTLLVLSAAPHALPQPGARTADQLIAAVLDARMTTGFRINAKLTRTTGDRGGAEISRPLVVLGRRDGRRTSVVYEEIGSKERPGRALLIEDAGDHKPAGTRFEHATATRIAAADKSAPFFDSDLSIEDVVDGFWYWHAHTIVGHDTLDKRACVIVEFRPDPGTDTHYSRVVAWISAELALPLKVEPYGADGQLEKRIVAGRIVKRDNRWAAGRLTVEPTGGSRRTVLEGSKFERNLNPPQSEFTIDAILGRLKRRR
jgi:hypothetical protein